MKKYIKIYLKMPNWKNAISCTSISEAQQTIRTMTKKHGSDVIVSCPNNKWAETELNLFQALILEGVK